MYFCCLLNPSSNQFLFCFASLSLSHVVAEPTKILHDEKAKLVGSISVFVRGKRMFYNRPAKVLLDCRGMPKRQLHSASLRRPVWDGQVHLHSWPSVLQFGGAQIVNWVVSGSSHHLAKCNQSHKVDAGERQGGPSLQSKTALSSPSNLWHRSKHEAVLGNIKLWSSHMDFRNKMSLFSR